MSADKQQILETITAVSRLITLAFKPKGTKIAIRDHNIVLCEPKTDTYYGIKIPQSVDRYWNGDSREDIYILNPVICNFIEWYIIPYKTKEPEIYRGLINMAKYLRVGLRDLQTTYRSGTAVGTLQYYIIVLTAVIEDKFYPEMLYNAASSGRKSFLDEDNDDTSDMIYSTIFDVDKFKTFWSREELKSLCSQFEKCFKNPGEVDNVVFKDTDLEIDEDDIAKPQSSASGSKESKRDSKDSLTVSASPKIPPTSGSVPKDDSLLLDLDSGFVEPTVKVHRKESKPRAYEPRSIHERSERPSSTKSWPVPKSLGNVIVQGHLVGIANILTIMDKKFTSMLNQSVKGAH